VVVGATATAIAPGNTSPLKQPQKIERGGFGGGGGGGGGGVGGWGEGSL
jgi:hypothetical protein